MKRALLTIAITLAVLLLVGCANNPSDTGRSDGNGDKDNDKKTYTITFDANGGSGVAPMPQQVCYGDVITLPKQGNMEMAKHTFAGWENRAIDVDTVYPSGARYVPHGSITLYAVWALPTVTTFVDDRDGKNYKKVTIGDQTWMAENLNYDVPDDTTDTCYDKSTSRCTMFGRLYRWPTAMGGTPPQQDSPVGAQGICPSGWHLPSRSEWQTLDDFAGGIYGAGTRLQADTIWNDHNGNKGKGTDNFGFSALPAGSGVFSDKSGFNFNNDIGRNGYWWTSTDYGDGDVWGRVMSSGSERISGSSGRASVMYSIRCVQD